MLYGGQSHPPRRRSWWHRPRQWRPPPQRVLRHSWRLRPCQVLNFGSLAYVVDVYGELHPLKGVELVDNESLASSPPLGLLGADIEVLAQQIRLSLGPIPTMPNHFWYYLLDLSYGI